jgi:uncharacterized protein (TIGR01244 family)
MAEIKTVVPGQFAITAQPAVDDVGNLAGEGYRTVIGNRPDNEQQGQPGAAQIGAAAREQGLEYAHIPVTIGSISREQVDAFRRTFADSPQPVVAHCGSGKRSFLLWAAGEVIHGGRPVDELLERASALGIDASELPAIADRLR